MPTITPNRAFTTATHTLDLLPVVNAGKAEDPSLLQSEEAVLVSSVDKVAAAAPILVAESAAVATLQQNDFPYATRKEHRTVAEMEGSTIEIVTAVDPGPKHVHDTLTTEGADDVGEECLRTYLLWQEVRSVDVHQLRDYQGVSIATGCSTPAPSLCRRIPHR